MKKSDSPRLRPSDRVRPTNRRAVLRWLIGVAVVFGVFLAGRAWLNPEDPQFFVDICADVDRRCYQIDSEGVVTPTSQELKATVQHYLVQYGYQSSTPPDSGWPINKWGYRVEAEFRPGKSSSEGARVLVWTRGWLGWQRLRWTWSIRPYIH